MQLICVYLRSSAVKLDHKRQDNFISLKQLQEKKGMKCVICSSQNIKEKNVDEEIRLGNDMVMINIGVTTYAQRIPP